MALTKSLAEDGFAAAPSDDRSDAGLSPSSFLMDPGGEAWSALGVVEAGADATGGFVTAGEQGGPCGLMGSSVFAGAGDGAGEGSGW